MFLSSFNREGGSAGNTNNKSFEIYTTQNWWIGNVLFGKFEICFKDTEGVGRAVVASLIEVVCGIVFGLILGVIIAVIPHKNMRFKVCMTDYFF